MTLTTLPRSAVPDEPLGSAIGIIDLAADEPTILPITPDSMTAWYPDWSWDTDRIVFQAGSGSPFEMVGEPPIICVIRPDGSDLTVLTDRAAGDPRVALPAWMPGGDRILLTLIHSRDRYTLATMSIDGVVTELVDADGAPIVGAHPRVPAR